MSKPEVCWSVEWRHGELDFLIERDDGAPLIVVRPRVRLGEEGRLDGATVAAVIAEALTRGLTECASCGLLMARYERVEEDEDGHVDVEHELCEGCREEYASASLDPAGGDEELVYDPAHLSDPYAPPFVPRETQRDLEERPERCPRCDSPAPHLHPAMQHEGEVQPCSDAWHAPPREAGDDAGEEADR